MALPKPILIATLLGGACWLAGAAQYYFYFTANADKDFTLLLCKWLFTLGGLLFIASASTLIIFDTLAYKNPERIA